MGRILLILSGVVVIGFGVVLLLNNVAASSYPNLIVWLAAGVVLHDIVLATIVACVGWIIGKMVPIGYRAYVQGGCIVAGAVAIMSIPVVIGAGRKADNPSLLPLDYPRNLLIVLVVIAVVTLVLAAVGQGQRSSTREKQESSA